MFLVKCSCGCIYTLHEKALDPETRYGKEQGLEPNAKRRCPECGMVHELQGREFYPLISDKDYTIYRVPDNAKIELTFKPDNSIGFGFSFSD